MSNPDSPLAKIFKARYYANTNLFKVTRGGGASFVWSGLWQDKETLMKGYKWVLGDGVNIKIFEDQWVRGKDTLMVENAYAELSSGMKACD